MQEVGLWTVKNDKNWFDFLGLANRQETNFCRIRAKFLGQCIPTAKYAANMTFVWGYWNKRTIFVDIAEAEHPKADRGRSISGISYETVAHVHEHYTRYHSTAPWPNSTWRCAKSRTFGSRLMASCGSWVFWMRFHLIKIFLLIVLIGVIRIRMVLWILVSQSKWMTFVWLLLVIGMLRITWCSSWFRGRVKLLMKKAYIIFVLILWIHFTVCSDLVLPVQYKQDHLTAVKVEYGSFDHC